MKRQLVAFLVIMLAATVAMQAQPGGGFQRPSVEDRVKRVHGKIDSAFKLEATKLANVDSIFANYYRAQDAKRDELRAGGTMDREVMTTEMRKLSDARDEKLKLIFTEDQYKIWKEQIEASLRGGGGRPPGGGNGNR